MSRTTPYPLVASDDGNGSQSLRCNYNMITVKAEDRHEY